MGCSTLITSAPKSPSMVAASGPAKRVARSRTRRPASGAAEVEMVEVAGAVVAEVTEGSGMGGWPPGG